MKNLNEYIIEKSSNILEEIIKYVKIHGGTDITIDDIYKKEAKYIELSSDTWKIFDPDKHVKNDYHRNAVLCKGFDKIAVSNSQPSRYDNPDIMVHASDGNWHKIGIACVWSQDEKTINDILDKLDKLKH